MHCDCPELLTEALHAVGYRRAATRGLCGAHAAGPGRFGGIRSAARPAGREAAYGRAAAAARDPWSARPRCAAHRHGRAVRGVDGGGDPKAARDHPLPCPSGNDRAARVSLSSRGARAGRRDHRAAGRPAGSHHPCRAGDGGVACRGDDRPVARDSVPAQAAAGRRGPGRPIRPRSACAGGPMLRHTGRRDRGARRAGRCGSNRVGPRHLRGRADRQRGRRALGRPAHRGWAPGSASCRRRHDPRVALRERAGARAVRYGERKPAEPPTLQPSRGSAATPRATRDRTCAGPGRRSGELDRPDPGRLARPRRRAVSRRPRLHVHRPGRDDRRRNEHPRR